MKLKQFGLVTLMTLSSFTVNAATMDDVAELQHTWAKVNYNLEGDAQEDAFEDLVKQADKVVMHNADSAEAYIWRGIIKSSYAGAKGGLGAMSLAKASKVDLEKALSINETALAGSALTSLGTLYAKVPGWPIGFGDDEKARELLQKALSINPDGIDSNYFYASFLADNRNYAEAEKFLLKAQNAVGRPDRPLADKGRRQEISALLDEIHSQQKQKGSLFQ